MNSIKTLQPIPIFDTNKLKKMSAKLETIVNSNLLIEENWQNFKRQFQLEQLEYFDMIYKNLPEITEHNVKLLCLKFLNYKNKEIGELLGINDTSVKKAMQRMRNKYGAKLSFLPLPYRSK